MGVESMPHYRTHQLFPAASARCLVGVAWQSWAGWWPKIWYHEAMASHLSSYPLFHGYLTAQSDERHRGSAYTDRRLEYLEKSLETWAKGMEEGTIENARLVESKESISRAIDAAWQAVPRDLDYLRTLSEAHYNALDTIPAPNLSNLAGRLKRVKATADHPIRTQLIELLEELVPLATQYEFLRANAVKRRPKTDEEKAAEFQPPPSSSAAVAAARTVLETAIDRTFQDLVSRRRASNQRRLDSYFAARDKVLSDPGFKGRGYTPHTHLSAHRAGYSRIIDQDGLSFLHHVLVPVTKKINDRYVDIYEQDDQTLEKSNALADKEARHIREQFLYKSLSKLTPILEAKGDDVFDKIQEVGRLNLEGREGEFLVSFKDGSSFRLRNAVVFVVNQFDTHFCRFPTTFHDVKLPGGVSMPSPSEERMHTLFAPCAEQQPGPTKSKPRR